MAAVEVETQVVLGLPDRLLLVVAVLVMAILVMATPVMAVMVVEVEVEVARQEQEATRRRQQTACLLFQTISLDQVKTLAS